MSYLRETKNLTHRGVMAMLNAAVEKAEAIGQPQCIVIVDASGELHAEIRMTGAKFLSRKSALAKAMTAASIGVETVCIPDEVRPLIGLATEGKVTGLPGGLPIIVEGCLVGGIGVGSGTGVQDRDVALAGLQAIGAET
ncbi:MAG: heme-binding protein [Roseibium sp.]|uniref:GlcG/HbpS family heme-binding protein n=1 Tax=Roseibium sp. TaxID=1936156 RepID=UPI00261B3632|nr:heme-binding protein [Roseibium sp.]MCV0427624.1 heme-binding protein [Roseibium sp.]